MSVRFLYVLNPPSLIFIYYYLEVYIIIFTGFVLL